MTLGTGRAIGADNAGGGVDEGLQVAVPRGAEGGAGRNDPAGIVPARLAKRVARLGLEQRVVAINTLWVGSGRLQVDGGGAEFLSNFWVARSALGAAASAGEFRLMSASRLRARAVKPASPAWHPAPRTLC